MRTGNLVMVAVVMCIAILLSVGPAMAGQKAAVLDGRARGLAVSKAVPDQLNYQGYLVDTADTSAVTATLEMTFRLFNSETDGTELWSETHAGVPVSNGLFQVLLGSVTPFPAGLFDGTQLWLQTEVGTEVLAPRKPCVSVAYSHRANSAEMLLDYTLTDLDDRWVNEDQASSVTSSMITDGEIDDADISATAAIDAGKISDGAGSGLDADFLDGMEAAAFAQVSHQHDDLYYTEDELSTSGTINDPSNPVDWTKLKGVPAGFADGTDDVGGAGGITQILEGDGIDVTDPTGPTTTVAAEFGFGSTQVARGNHDHDADYVNEEDLDHLDAADGTPANAVYVDAAGNVGVGTTSPQRSLHLYGATNRVLLIEDSANEDTWLEFKSNGQSDWSIGVREFQDDLYFTPGYYTETPAVTIRRSDGNVGIGVTAPNQELHVRGTSWTTPLADGSYLGGWVVGDYDAAVDEKYFAVWSNGEYLVLGKSNDAVSSLTHNVQIQRNGDVGIGKTPSCRLEAYVSDDTTAHFRTSWGSGNAIGCYGEATPGASYDAKGVYGKCEPSENYGYGVYGTGGYIGTYGHVSQSGAPGANYYGSRGYGSLSTSNGTVYGVYGYGVGGSAHYGVYYSGGLGGSGTKSAIVRTQEGPMAVYCQESPENWFEDFGSGEIHGGRAEVQLAGDFRLTVTINDSYPMKVFITPNADIGRWWVEKDNTGFVLMAPEAPQGAQFDYRIVAKRKGYEGLRLERTPAAYADHYLYPDLDGVPPQYREEWIRSAPPEVQAEYGVKTTSSSPTEEDIPVTTKDSILKKSR